MRRFYCTCYQYHWPAHRVGSRLHLEAHCEPCKSDSIDHLPTFSISNLNRGKKCCALPFPTDCHKKPDPEIERSNLSHRKFIDALIEAFEALGGREWESESKAQKSVQEDEDDVIFANKFSTLDVHESKDNDELELEQEDEDDEYNVPGSEVHAAVAALRSVGPKKSAGKGKKGKRGKYGKKAKSKKPATIEVSLDDIPLESYRIIDSEGGGLITDYLIAVYSLVEQWVKLRHDLQEIWQEASYEGLNGAVAGALSNVAVAMVKQTQSAIFVDFPGHDSYETVMKTITRGDPEKAQGNFHLTLHRIGPSNDKAEKVQETDIDVKEQFMIHTYWNLLDFITDFQHTYSGKPTKRFSPKSAIGIPTLIFNKLPRNSA
jgi:hypothetical protein